MCGPKDKNSSAGEGFLTATEMKWLTRAVVVAFLPLPVALGLIVLVLAAVVLGIGGGS